jgi:hypothetical protein
MRFVAGFQIVVGVAVTGLWAVLLATGQVPEVQAGQVDIWFHVAAELGMAGLLVGAGAALLRQAPRAGLLSALALGWLGYSAVNSPGYYAETGDWAVVGMFGLVLALTAAAFAFLWKHTTRAGPPALDAAPPQADLATAMTGGEP